MSLILNIALALAFLLYKFGIFCKHKLSHFHVKHFPQCNCLSPDFVVFTDFYVKIYYFCHIFFQLGIDASHQILKSTDVHIHFPAGAISKDGPSAGVTIATVLVSLFTARCVRSDTAMTGEVTLRGLVLPVEYMLFFC